MTNLTKSWLDLPEPQPVSSAQAATDVIHDGRRIGLRLPRRMFDVRS